MLDHLPSNACLFGPLFKNRTKQHDQAVDDIASRVIALLLLINIPKQAGVE